MTDAISRSDTAVPPHERRSTHAGDHADWLIDNAETYDRVLEALHRARRWIRIAQLAFDADCMAYAGRTSTPLLDVAIADALIGLAKRAAPEMQILLNATWLLDTARPLRRHFAKCGIAPDRIHVRGFSRFPHFMHAKLVLVDGREAFLLGSPFVNSYWDDPRHAPLDARRPLRELGGRPLHDVSVHLHGRIVGALESTFASVWKAADPEGNEIPPRKTFPVARSAASGGAGMRLVCDAPDGILPDAPDGATEFLDVLLEGIARARSFIYVEHQYLTSRPIVAALAAALCRAPTLELIIVLNQNPDLTAYRGWQNARLAESGLLAHPRVGVFALWSADEHPERTGVTRLNQLFVHSKVLVVDDEWAIVGTSNLDGVSVGSYGDDFTGALGRRIFRGVRNVEMNVVLDAGDARAARGEHAREADSIRELRERLWREHLGTTRASLRERPAEGWLATWRTAAANNVRVLSCGSESGEPAPARGHRSEATSDGTRQMIGHVLPYSAQASPRRQLADLGIHFHRDQLELCYDPGWLEVHTSPHWIRNIF